MVPYAERSTEELLALKKELEKTYKEFQAKNLKLDMSRGKPSAEQLDLSMGMMDILNSSTDLKCREGIDCRNYGVLDGIQEAKELLSAINEVPSDKIIIYGNSSLNEMCIRDRHCICQNTSYRWQMSASIGVSLFPRDGKDFSSLYQKADCALYKTKKNGKNGFTVYEKEESSSEMP